MRDQVRALIVECYERARAEHEDANASGLAAASTGPTDTTALFGIDSALDSMGLVALVLDIEEQLADRLGVEVTLMDERALSRRHSPFRTVGTLTDYVVEIAGGSPVEAA
jgi:acyl carrier protein